MGTKYIEAISLQTNETYLEDIIEEKCPFVIAIPKDKTMRNGI